MILDAENTNRKMAGFAESTSFRIASSKMMFEILSSRLYSRPIDSIVRELYTNAMEVSSPDHPPIVLIPTALDPTFTISDSGPGLSDDDMKRVYIEAGTSTKRDSNEAIGAFGLGAKSPFSYTDTYTIISSHGGISTRYLVHRTDDGLPRLTKVSSTPAHNTGITISIPVKVGDIHRFTQAITSELSEMPIKPSLPRGGTLLPRTRIHSEGNVHLISRPTIDSQRASGTPTVLVMGGPVYPINFSAHPDLAPYRPLSSHFLLDAPIGSVDLTPSREELIYTPKTVSFIVKSFTTIQQSLQTELHRQFAACKTYREAWEFIHKTKHDFAHNAPQNPKNSLAAVLGYYAPNLVSWPSTWGTMTLHERPHIGKLFYTPKGSVPDPTFFCEVFQYFTTPLRRRKVGKASVPESYLTYSPDVTFFIMDDDKYPFARIQAYAQAHFTSTAYLVYPKSDAALDTLLPYIKDWAPIRVSTLPPYTPPKRLSAKNPISTHPRYTSPVISLDDYWPLSKTTNTIPWAQGGYYVYSYRHQIALSKDGHYHHTSYYLKFLNTIPIPTPIIAVVPDKKKAFESFLSKNPTLWTSLKDYFATSILKDLNDLQLPPPNIQKALATLTQNARIIEDTWIPPKFQALKDQLESLTKAVDAFDATWRDPISKAGTLAQLYVDLTGNRPSITTTNYPTLETQLKDLIDFLATPEARRFLSYMETCRRLSYYENPNRNENVRNLILTLS